MEGSPDLGLGQPKALVQPLEEFGSDLSIIVRKECHKSSSIKPECCGFLIALHDVDLAPNEFAERAGRFRCRASEEELDTELAKSF